MVVTNLHSGHNGIANLHSEQTAVQPNIQGTMAVTTLHSDNKCSYDPTFSANGGYKPTFRSQW